MKPFDIDAAKRGEPVVTRDGRKAEYVGYFPKFLDGYRLLFAIENDTKIRSYYDNGFYTGEGRGTLDLFMAAPSIPEGFTPYDPNVPPPYDVEEIEVVTDAGCRLVFYTWMEDWRIFSHIIAYRVTKRKPLVVGLEDVINKLAAKLQTDPQGRDLDYLREFLHHFAQAIIKEAKK